MPGTLPAGPNGCSGRLRTPPLTHADTQTNSATWANQSTLSLTNNLVSGGEKGEELNIIDNNHLNLDSDGGRKQMFSLTKLPYLFVELCLPA